MTDVSFKQWFRSGVWRHEIRAGEFAQLSIATRTKFERMARTIRPHLVVKDLFRLLFLAPTPIFNELKSQGFAQVNLSLPESIVSRIEDEVSVFEGVLRSETRLEEMPELWQREFRKTSNQPLRHVPIEYRKNLVHDIYVLLNNSSIYNSCFRYFRARPILKNVRVLYSQNSESVNLESQQFHRDPEGSKQVKVFITVREVTLSTGPLAVISRLESEAVIRNDGENVRYTDEVVERSVPAQNWNMCMGPTGTTWLVDTSNCLHFGSRRGTSPRVLIYAQLLPWYSAFLPGRRPLGLGHWLNRPPARPST